MDQPSYYPPGLHSFSFSFVALTPLHQGISPNPMSLGYQTSWDQTPWDHMAQWDLCCTFQLGDECCYLITNIIECLREGWANPVRTPPEVLWP